MNTNSTTESIKTEYGDSKNYDIQITRVITSFDRKTGGIIKQSDIAGSSFCVKTMGEVRKTRTTNLFELICNSISNNIGAVSCSFAVTMLTHRVRGVVSCRNFHF